MPVRKGQHARPHALLYPVAHRDDGTPVMVADRVAEALRLGASYRTAAARAGISVSQLDAWLRAGNRHSAALAAGHRQPDELSAVELAELSLATSAEQALSQLELNLLAQLEQLSRGGTTTTTVIRTDGDGRLIEERRQTEQRVPDGQAIRWRLERRLPEQWAPRAQVEHSGTVSVDVAARAAELAEAIRAGQGGKAGKGG